MALPHTCSAPLYNDCQNTHQAWGQPFAERDQICQICYEEMRYDEPTVTHLLQCRTTWHQECFDIFFQGQWDEPSQTKLLCPNCRTILRSFRKFSVIIQPFHDPVRYIEYLIPQPQMVLLILSTEQVFNQLPQSQLDFLFAHTDAQIRHGWSRWFRISFLNSNEVFMVPVVFREFLEAKHAVEHMVDIGWLTFSGGMCVSRGLENHVVRFPAPLEQPPPGWEQIM